MDNKEAIEWLKAIEKKYIRGGDEQYDNSRKEAIDMAIKSLERDRDSYDIGYTEGHADGVLKGEKLYAPKLGEWIDHSDEGYIECPFCGSATTCEDNKAELHYCFSCGAFLQ